MNVYGIACKYGNIRYISDELVTIKHHTTETSINVTTAELEIIKACWDAEKKMLDMGTDSTELITGVVFQHVEPIQKFVDSKTRALKKAAHESFMFPDICNRTGNILLFIDIEYHPIYYDAKSTDLVYVYAHRTLVAISIFIQELILKIILGGINIMQEEVTFASNLDTMTKFVAKFSAITDSKHNLLTIYKSRRGPDVSLVASIINKEAFQLKDVLYLFIYNHEKHFIFKEHRGSIIVPVFYIRLADTVVS